MAVLFIGPSGYSQTGHLREGGDDYNHMSFGVKPEGIHVVDGATPSTPRQGWNFVGFSAEAGYSWKSVADGLDARTLLAVTWGCRPEEIEIHPPIFGVEIPRQNWQERLDVILFFRGHLLVSGNTPVRAVKPDCTEGGGGLVPIPTEYISWPDSKYAYARLAARRCVAEGMAKKVETWGGSGVENRNLIVLLGLPTVDAEGWEAKLSETWTILDQRKTAQILDPKIVGRCLEIRQEEKEKEATLQWPKFFDGSSGDVVEVSCFNDKLASKFPPPAGYAVVSERSTTRSNTTVVIVRVGQIIRCPDSLKGLLIGKGGVTIKELARRNGLGYIKVI